jgi:SAM-dependent methyltransferase
MSLRILRRARSLVKYAAAGPVLGRCPICEKRVVFIKTGPWLRDELLCHRCRSIPRWRALIYVLETRYPRWRDLDIHESSPCGPASEKLARECQHYTPTHFFAGIAPGQFKQGIRCENLERQTFVDATFDLVITSDVFEHVLDPASGFSEIARTLRPGGAHVFTVPWYWWKRTLIRASRNEDGSLTNLEPPDYHGNPIDLNGSLVVTEWGSDFCDFIYRSSGLTTTAVLIKDKQLGLAGEFCEVFVSAKRASALIADSAQGSESDCHVRPVNL